MKDPEFIEEATSQFNEVPARGPYTLAMSNSAIFVSLPNVTKHYQDIIERIRTVASDGTAASYLPLDVASDLRMVTGYEHQLFVLADLLENPEAPSLESGFATGNSMRFISLHTLSRGTVRLNLTSPLEQPIIDYRASSNPLDLDVHLAHARYLRRAIKTPTMQDLGTVEVAPGGDVQSDGDLAEYIKNDFTFSFMHPCCTAAMLPEDEGGVVSRDMSVHGADGLRIVDMSILPLAPSSHLSALAYAVGEKVGQSLFRHRIAFLTSVGCRYHHQVLVRGRLSSGDLGYSRIPEYGMCQLLSTISLGKH